MRAAPLAMMLLIASTPRTAHADRRSFFQTYEYQTMNKGGVELELWNEQDRPDFGSAATGLQFQLEIEYGITDRWDIALYQILSQPPPTMTTPGVLAYDATKIETRYRFAERG